MTINLDHIFHDGWMSYEIVDAETLHYYLNIDPESILSLKAKRFKDIRLEAVNSALEFVGPNPAIMLSGGIDSQLMVHCFLEAGYDVSPVILEYDGKNQQDIQKAFDFCEYLRVKPTIINHPVKWFLNRGCIEMGLRYGLRSPQFTCHARACEILDKAGYSGAIFGGNAPYKKDEWVYGSTAAQLLDLPTFSSAVKWPIISSFCSWTWSLGLILAALDCCVDDRYASKLAAYDAFGVHVLPQEKKLTGFEQIKNEVDEAENMPGYFELRYRVPLYAKTKNQDVTKLILTGAQKEALDDLAEYFKKELT